MAKENSWTLSPLTNEEHVLTELDEKTGVSKMCIGSGYFTNEYPLNYKKNPDFDLSTFENGMPELMKALKFDDGESYWYPTSIRTNVGMVFPVGESIDNWQWCYAPVKELTPSEKKDTIAAEYDSKLDMDNAQYFERFMDASKELSGMDWNELS